MPLTKRNVEVPLPCSTRTDLTVENLISTQTTQEQSFKKVSDIIIENKIQYLKIYNYSTCSYL